MSTDYNSKEYVRSRNAYKMQYSMACITEVLVTDVVLAKLLTTVGMSDALIGVVTSLTGLAYLVQLLSIFTVNKIKNVKHTVMLFETFSQLLFSLMYVIPLLPLSKGLKIGVLACSLLLAYVSKYYVTNMLFKWANSFVDPWKRGEYTASRDRIAIFAGTLFLPVGGFIIDKFEDIGNLKGGFLLISVMVLIINILHFISLCSIKNQVVEASEQHSLKEVFENTLKNKYFINVTILTCTWSIALSLTYGFLATFKINDLLLSVGACQLINIGANLTRIVVAKRIGKYTDKTSFAKGYNVGLAFAAVGLGLNMFTTQNSIWCIVAFHILLQCGIPAINYNASNMIYSYVDKDYMVPAMAIRSCISGLVGFGATFVGSFILSAVQSRGNVVFGHYIYGQQILSGISFVITIIAILFNRCVVQKQKIMKQ